MLGGPTGAEVDEVQNNVSLYLLAAMVRQRETGRVNQFQLFLPCPFAITICEGGVDDISEQSRSGER